MATPLSEVKEISEKTEICPNCGSEMKLRTRKSDGKQFWGCSNFFTTGCKGYRPYNGYSQPVQKKAFTPSKYQLAIFDFVKNGKGHGVVRATAGAGKTKTLEESAHYVDPSLKIGFLAFNVSIADELSRRIANVHSSTFHSLGKSNILAFFPDAQLDKIKTGKILDQILSQSGSLEYLDAVKQNQNNVLKLVDLLKATLLDPTPENFNWIEDRFGIVVNGEADYIHDAAKRVYETSIEQTETYDFEDMIFFCATGIVPCKKFDFLFVDECLPYKTPVLLADGTSKEIGEIVEKRLPVKVLSYDVNTGKQKVCQVTNWHKLVNQKPLVKIKVKWKKRQNTNVPSNFVVCTIDHKIWTNRGYVEAGNLKPGMIVQVETSAAKSQSYKISEKGKVSLSGEMSKKNKTGVCGQTKEGGIINRGGNGKGLSTPQKYLLEALGGNWQSEYVVKTKTAGGQKFGYPNNYKIDIANPHCGIAIEVDGHTHDLPTRKEQDKKKTDCLNQLGWDVYRFSNDYVMHHLKEIAQQFSNTDCPIDARVESVVPITLKDWFVYDITVEDCHNFYANGILVHNCQDSNKAQIQMVLNSITKDGRVVCVGDVFQAIYSFRGADTEAIQNLTTALNAKEFPLSITYRCPKAVVRYINNRFPHIPFFASDNAIEGVVSTITEAKMHYDLKDGDLVLCRTNAPLVEHCFSVIRRGQKAVILGREIGKGLQTLIQKIVKKYKINSITELLYYTKMYSTNEVMKLISADKRTQAETLQDQVETIIALSDGCNTLWELDDRIKSVFTEKGQGVVFSSIHKAKGGEADRVYIIRPDLIPHKMAIKPHELEQEEHIEFVALSRTKNELHFVR